MITVYSTPQCPYCHMAKSFLKDHNKEFNDVDVSKSRDAAMEMIRKSGQMGVPVLDIDGRIIVGYDVEAIKESLKIA